jgi:DNA-binding CsgD family transcriptional regulator
VRGEVGLTARDDEVLVRLADGDTKPPDRQIARSPDRQGGMTEKTVSIHVSRILAKLAVPNRSAAAAAHRLGLLGRDAGLPSSGPAVPI